MKYLRSMTFGNKDIEIRKSEFVQETNTNGQRCLGIFPCWDDKMNKNGGRWVYSYRHDDRDKHFYKY